MILSSDADLEFSVVLVYHDFRYCEIVDSLSVCIVHNKLLSEVAENSAAEPERLRKNERNFVLAAICRHFQLREPFGFGVYNGLVLRQLAQVYEIDAGYFLLRIELFQLFCQNCTSLLSDVALSEERVGTEVQRIDWLWVSE